MPTNRFTWKGRAVSQHLSSRMHLDVGLSAMAHTRCGFGRRAAIILALASLCVGCSATDVSGSDDAVSDQSATTQSLSPPTSVGPPTPVAPQVAEVVVTCRSGWDSPDGQASLTALDPQSGSVVFQRPALGIEEYGETQAMTDYGQATLSGDEGCSSDRSLYSADLSAVPAVATLDSTGDVLPGVYSADGTFDAATEPTGSGSFSAETLRAQVAKFNPGTDELWWIERTSDDVVVLHSPTQSFPTPWPIDEESSFDYTTFAFDNSGRPYGFMEDPETGELDLATYADGSAVPVEMTEKPPALEVPPTQMDVSHTVSNDDGTKLAFNTEGPGTSTFGVWVLDSGNPEPRQLTASSDGYDLVILFTNVEMSPLSGD